MFWILFSLFATIVTPINSKYASPCLTTEQLPGICMPVKSCKTIYNFFLRMNKSGGTISQEDKTKLEPLFCGIYENVPHVCCPKSEIQLNAEGLNILERSPCGMFTDNRIAHGQPVSLFQFPWMALLEYAYNDEETPFKCGATLISDQYVLTAAHCVKGKEDVIIGVRLGEYQISTQRDCTNVTRKNQCAPPAEDFEVEEFIVHEDYDSFYNDIALIRLNRKVTFQRHIKPICLPIYDCLRSKVHENYVVAGWGTTEHETTSDILLAAFVPNVNRSVCENALRPHKLTNSLNYGQFCAGGKDLVDSCRGDSGGPLGYRDFYNQRPRFIQFGIVSVGLYYCGVINAPGIYTNVSHYMQWITDNIKEHTRKIQNEHTQNVHIITPRFIQG